jgi:arylsulfatase A-like enzyme
VRPNVLLVVSDQHRADFTTRNPQLPLRTPVLDSLAEQGTALVEVTTPSPLCAPARACLASGRSYDRCGVPNNRVDYPIGQPTYYSALREGGYWVGGVGKFDLHKRTEHWGLDGTRCLAEWGFDAGRDSEGKMDAVRSGATVPQGPYMAFLHEHGLAEAHVRDFERRHAYRDTAPTPLPDFAYCDNWVADGAVRLLEEAPADRPWHLVVNFVGPHDPMDVTAGMQARWEGVRFPPPDRNDDADRETHDRIRRNYAAMIENIDRHVGRMLEVLDARGERERTVVVYTSDHGEMLGDGNRWGKATFHRPSVSVPFVAAGPGIAAGRLSDALVSLHDVAATVLDYAGCALPEGMDARSFRPVLEGRSDRHRPFVVSGLMSTPDQMAFYEQYHSERLDDPILADWRMLSDGRHKLVLSTQRPPMLFDLVADPGETNDVAAEQPELVDRLAALLLEALGADPGRSAWQRPDRAHA